MDWIMDINLDSIRKQIVFQNLLFKEDFECWIVYDWPNSRNGRVQLLARLASWFKPSFCS